MIWNGLKMVPLLPIQKIKDGTFMNTMLAGRLLGLKVSV